MLTVTVTLDSKGKVFNLLKKYCTVLQESTFSSTSNAETNHTQLFPQGGFSRKEYGGSTKIHKCCNSVETSQQITPFEVQRDHYGH